MLTGRRASKVLSCRRYVGAYCAFTVATPRYAGSFPAPVRMRVRVGEVLKLRVRAVDLNQGIITVRQGSSAKTGWFLPPYSVVHRLRKYASHFERRRRMHSLPWTQRRPFALRTSTHFFVNCCCSVGFPMRGPARDPESTTIATFRRPYLRRWYRYGEDLDAKLLFWPLLGHQHLSGTQRYLHLTAEIFLRSPHE